jgi:hypothetical protein
MAIRVRAYTSTPSGGPANAAWRYWHDTLCPKELISPRRSEDDVGARNITMLRAYEKWLSANYGAHIDYHREGNETDRLAELVFQDDAKATLFLLRFP